MKKFSEFKSLKKLKVGEVIISKSAWASRELIWSKDKKIVAIICISKSWKMDSQEFDQFCKMINRIEKIESTNNDEPIIIEEVKPLKMEGKKTMLKNFVIGSRDAGLVIGSLAKAKEAKPAVKEVKGVKEVIAIAAVPEKKDPKTGKVIQKKVKAVKGVKGVKAAPAIPAQPAFPEGRTVILKCKTEGIAQEIIARMADQGYVNAGEVKHIEPGTFDLTYKAESDKPIRAAFKKCKSKDGYNQPGLDALAGSKKAEAKVKKDAEAEKETTISGKKKGDDSTPKEDTEDDDSGWPES